MKKEYRKELEEINKLFKQSKIDATQKFTLEILLLLKETPVSYDQMKQNILIQLQRGKSFT